MEYAYIIIGTLAIWAFLATQAKNPHLRSLLIFQVILLAYAATFAMRKAALDTDVAAVALWGTSMHWAVWGFIGTWAIFWVIAKFEKEDMDDEQEL